MSRIDRKSNASERGRPRPGVPPLDAIHADEEAFGIAWLPDAARHSAAWAEWCSVFLAIEDGDIDVTPEEVGVIVEIAMALRRRRCVFHPRLAALLEEWAAALTRSDEDREPDVEEWAAALTRSDEDREPDVEDGPDRGEPLLPTIRREKAVRR